MTDSDLVRKVAFLDTNTLHFIGIYLKYARSKDLFPWGSVGSADGKATAIQSVEDLQEHALKNSLKRGLETVDFLATLDVEVQYSPVSELELLTGRTRGAAIRHAAEEGVPDRMWSKFREDEIRERVPLAETTDIKEAVDRLTTMIEESGVAVATKTTEQANYTLELAKGINGLIYIEAMDSIIYAGALIAQADYLLTTDGYLKDTVNSIHRPGGEPRYETIRRRLQELVTQIILGDVDDIQLPSAHTVTADGNLKPDLPVSAPDRSP